MSATMDGARSLAGRRTYEGPRILIDPPATDLGAHLLRYGQGPGDYTSQLVAEVAATGLRGRGGAGFPTAIKMQAVLDAARTGRGRNRVPVVVANGTEGEPASGKDKVLLAHAPHLVMDGMVATSLALGADRAVLCIDRRSKATLAAAHRALGERRDRDPVALEIAETPARYTTGEETALVSWLNGGPAKPAFAPPRPSQSGVGGAPTLVDNVETLANIALIAFDGADAYSRVGEGDEPGTVLVTIGGAVRDPGVREVEIGTPVAALLQGAGSADPAAVLIGGYFGTWLTPAEASQARLSRRSLGVTGASLGCGLIAVVPDHHCPLQEVTDVLEWLANSSAGQCGACVNGLPALAGAFRQVASGGDPTGRASSQLDRWAPMIAGRGACKLPDGAVRFLDSARRVFSGHVEQHRHAGPCPPNRSKLLPTPRQEGWR